MSRGRCVIAAAFLAVIVAFGRAIPAAATDLDDPQLMLFSGRDFWRNGAFMYGGMIWAPGGFEQDGFMFKLIGAGGGYRYTAGSLGGETVYGAEWSAAVMPGFRIRRGNTEMKIFAGPEFVSRYLWPDDPGNRQRGDAFGVRFAGELWSEPTAETMVAADASFATTGAVWSARLAAGYRLFGIFYGGPETQVYGADAYEQFRLGGHITSLRADDVEWSAAVGWAFDTDRRGSPYLRLGLSWRSE